MNHVINRRMSYRPQMRWDWASAHRMLMVRVELLEGRLEDCFRMRLPGFRSPQAPRTRTAPTDFMHSRGLLNSTTAVQRKLTAKRLRTAVFLRCYLCLILNPLKVESPYWPIRWTTTDICTLTGSTAPSARPGLRKDVGVFGSCLWEGG